MKVNFHLNNGQKLVITQDVKINTDGKDIVTFFEDLKANKAPLNALYEDKTEAIATFDDVKSIELIY